MSLLELVASALGLACVWLTVKRHIACWPTGLAMVVLYIYIFYVAKLYADMALQVVFVGVQIYGWRNWLYGGPNHTPLVVSRLPIAHWFAWLLGGAAISASVGFALQHFTDASLPYLDAAIAIASLIAQWWLGRKLLEAWLVWIQVDIASIGMYVMKELYFTAALYAVFLVMAIWGWCEWRRAWKNQATASF